jgi:hypothetical protein
LTGLGECNRYVSTDTRTRFVLWSTARLASNNSRLRRTSISRISWCLGFFQFGERYLKLSNNCGYFILGHPRR